jgi:2-methylcitrate dehydratase PrpD
MTWGGDAGTWLAGLRIDDVPEPAQKAVVRAFVDTAAAIRAGASAPEAQPWLEFAKTADVQSAGGDPHAAALVMGALAHLLEADDVFPPMMGHLSAVVVPALLAASRIARISGSEAICGYVAGAEIAGRLGEASAARQYSRGLHTTGTLGVVAAAAAAARALRLPPSAAAGALALSTSSAGGLRCQFGWPAKSAHAGQAAADGLRAALLARSGVQASPAAFEGAHGYVQTYGGQLEPLGRASWGSRWLLDDPGLVVKPYPTCGATHRVLRALTDCLAATTRPTDIAEIDIAVSPLAASIVDIPDPAASQAAFSAQHTAAVLVVHGMVTRATVAVVDHPAVAVLRERIQVRVHPSLRDEPDLGLAEVTLRETAGGVHTRECRVAPGGRDEPLPDEVLDERLAETFADPVDAATAVRTVRELATCPDLSGVDALSDWPAAAEWEVLECHG